MSRPVVIGITGGSGSGKTSIANTLMEHFAGKSITLIHQDAYYKDQSHMTMDERIKTNYDHPSAFDNDLMVSQLKRLLNYEAIEMPIYDYTIHTRAANTELINPAEVILVEGLMVLENEDLRNVTDVKIFVDTDADIRIIRRIARDTVERGRTLESITEQYINVVRPMHNQFIEPTKEFADIIVPEGAKNTIAIDLLITKIQSILESKATV